jgi:2'-5' RNA ligase
MKKVRRNAPEQTGRRIVDPDSKPWRVFCAIDMPDQVGGLLSSHIQTLQKQSPDTSASWPRQEKFHLTLKFLGNISQHRIADLSQAAQLAAETIGPFKISIGGAGVFPQHGPPRVLWIGVEDPTGLLQRLQASLEEECSRKGFEAEERKFHPHLTIARLRDATGARELARAHLELRFPLVEVLIKDLRVYRSELGSEGSKYTVISAHPFQR